MLKNTSEKIPIFIDQCNSTRNITNTETDTDIETDSDFNRISINSDARKSWVKKTKLSIMGSLFELITWKVFYLVNNTDLINDLRWFNHLNISQLIAREN